MEIPGPTSGIPQAVTGKSAGISPQWQIGQQLQATVLENSTGKLLLAIGNRQVSAETSLPFERGQALTLEVRNLGQQPVLRVIAALQESATAMAVRTLLPRHGTSAPLLASLVALARTPNAPVPPLLQEAARALLTNLPTVGSISNAAGVKSAVQNSGLFLESRLLQGGGNTTPAVIQSDFKANLVRLVHLVRNWPGSTQPASPTSRSPTTQPAGQAATPAVSGQGGSSQAPAPSVAPGSSGNTQAPVPAATGNSGATGQQHPPVTASPDQVKRSLQGTQVTPPTTARGPAGTLLPAAGTLTATAGTPTTATAAASLNPPPPFAGVVPLPQASVQASLDFINRLGNLRLDLLQQTEAALARVQLGQLTALPREGERGLIEWLFDIPVRRAEDVDLWSARLYRDRDTQDDAERRQASPGWSIQLAFDLPGLGPMQAQIQLHGEQVSTHFWTSQQETLPLLRENLHELRQALLGAGLEVGEIDCQAGRIPDPPGKSAPPLISEKA